MISFSTSVSSPSDSGSPSIFFFFFFFLLRSSIRLLSLSFSFSLSLSLYPGHIKTNVSTSTSPSVPPSLPPSNQSSPLRVRRGYHCCRLQWRPWHPCSCSCSCCTFQRPWWLLLPWSGSRSSSSSGGADSGDPDRVRCIHPEDLVGRGVFDKGCRVVRGILQEEGIDEVLFLVLDLRGREGGEGGEGGKTLSLVHSSTEENREGGRE